MLTNLLLNVHTYLHIILMQFTVLKNKKFSLIKKIFREINSLVTSLLSRNFCQKRVRHLCVFHTHTVEFAKFFVSLKK